MESIYARVRRNIDESGQHLFGVHGDETETGFMYTVGNAERGLPELLLLIGDFNPNIIGMALNALGDKMRKSEGPLPEGMVDIDWTYPFKVRGAGELAKTKYTIQAGRFLGREDYKVLQVMICDKNGLYPGDPGCDPAFDVEQP